MIGIIFFIVFIGALAGIVILVYGQIRLVRSGQVVVTGVQPLPELIRGRIDWAYFHFALAFKQLVHYSYFYFLLATRRVLVIVRFLLTRVERKCARLIDSVCGRGVLHKRGAVSLFLAEIKRPKDL